MTETFNNLGKSWKSFLDDESPTYSFPNNFKAKTKSNIDLLMGRLWLILMSHMIIIHIKYQSVCESWLDISSQSAVHLQTAAVGGFTEPRCLCGSLTWLLLWLPGTTQCFLLTQKLLSFVFCFFSFSSTLLLQCRRADIFDKLGRFMKPI